MFRLTLSALALTFAALAGNADDKKDTTTWVRESNGVDLKFEIGKDTATFHVFVGENGVSAKAKLTHDKDKVTAELTDVEEKGNFPGKPKKGDKLTFKWVVKGDTATLSDFTSDTAGDAKDVIEGEYKQKK